MPETITAAQRHTPMAVPVPDIRGWDMTPVPSRAGPSWHVLIVESDPRSSESVLNSLRRYGHTAFCVDTGHAALRRHAQADVILLDLDLPDMDGLELCRTIRATSDSPLLAVTPRRSELDCVLGLQAGADDFLVKPYGFRELLARMEAVMRRTRTTPSASATLLTYGPLSIDPGTRSVLLHGHEIPLTRKEFDLLHLLAAQPHQVLPRRQILQHVWHDTDLRRSRTIDTHVNSLRKKLGSHSWVITIRGVGYRLGSL
ncbi:response regulator transcription factor [Streptomyces iconiensis]|uniref:Response regulator transcription factor n=1 Tax=Streptomyces iconiensis TaxID=1384038 RepID=A0ABT7A1P0_9ACTN|nr:response regulator transcription factor [Streptomyces iconiensis]MDJ1134979.1 response regulator transcription factor [Streptomyces iconiensis]